MRRAPAPDAVKYLDSVIAAAAVAGGDSEVRVGFADDEFIAVQPLMVRGSSVPVGWLAATRALSPALLARLRESAGGSLTGSPMRQIHPAELPADVRAWLGVHLGDTFGLSSKVFDDLSSYAVLRDAWGRPAWVFRLDPDAAAAVVRAAPNKGVLGMPSEAFLALLALLVGAGVFLALSVGYLDPASFNLTLSIGYVAALIIGGAWSVVGLALGSLFYVLVPAELAGLWDQLVQALVALARDGLAHGDLSAYNVLVHHGRLVMIDLPQVVDVIANPRGAFFLTRDAENIGRWFAHHGLAGVRPEPADLAALLRREARLE